MTKRLVAIIFFVLATTAVAQTGTDDLPFAMGQVGPSGSGRQLLLRMADVHAELKLTPSVIDRMAEILVDSGRRRRQLFQSILDGNVFEGSVESEDLRGLLDLFNRDLENTLTRELLSRDQAKRLNELYWQMQGAACVFDVAVAEKISLSERQVEELARQRRSLNVRGDVRTVRDVNVRLMPILSSPQRSKLKQLQGRPFAFRVLRRIVEAEKSERFELKENTASRNNSIRVVFGR